MHPEIGVWGLVIYFASNHSVPPAGDLVGQSESLAQCEELLGSLYKLVSDGLAVDPPA